MLQFILLNICAPFIFVLLANIFYSWSKIYFDRHATNIYKILKIIDNGYKNKQPINFDLKSLNITEHELGLYLHNLIEANYIEGIIVSKALNQTYFEKYRFYQYARLTLDGMLFYESNTTIKRFCKNLKETVEFMKLFN
ncbi:hypothetical protein VC03_02725 [Sneathia vaginalis]|jgi:hypothetical protein|uniref:Uncharacterized protein n=1 Tax=Sneathia vaginalis TaxID=187101 RepID=A0A0E3UUN9_9FUSO|nr:YjcQ family protein [Sneathia vaginalis]AKC95453.1 hypothetical protein VC03_02725 [Sneathia vaginalis]